MLLSPFREGDRSILLAHTVFVPSKQCPLCGAHLAHMSTSPAVARETHNGHMRVMRRRERNALYIGDEVYDVFVSVVLPGCNARLHSAINILSQSVTI